jgi:hypothetical protein
LSQRNSTSNSRAGTAYKDTEKADKSETWRKKSAYLSPTATHARRAMRAELFSANKTSTQLQCDFDETSTNLLKNFFVRRDFCR